MIAKTQLAAGQKDRALIALRRRKYQQSLLTKTDQQLENLEQLVCPSVSSTLLVFSSAIGFYHRILLGSSVRISWLKARKRSVEGNSQGAKP